jgi:hypothetical protein
MEKEAPEKRPQTEIKEEKGSQVEQEALQTKMKEREKSRWLALLREAEVIAANLKESGTRR